MQANTDINRVAVVGTGLIGSSWAACFLAHGLDVVATDPAPGTEARVRTANVVKAKRLNGRTSENRMST